MAKAEYRNEKATKKVTADEWAGMKQAEWALLENYVEGDIRYHEIMPADKVEAPARTLKDLKAEADERKIKYESTVTREELEKLLAKGK